MCAFSPHGTIECSCRKEKTARDTMMRFQSRDRQKQWRSRKAQDTKRDPNISDFKPSRITKNRDKGQPACSSRALFGKTRFCLCPSDGPCPLHPCFFFFQSSSLCPFSSHPCSALHGFVELPCTERLPAKCRHTEYRDNHSRLVRLCNCNTNKYISLFFPTSDELMLSC